MSHVLHARRLLLLVLHANKAHVFGQILRGPIDSMLPASLLRFHPHVEVVAVQSIAEILEEDPLTAIRSDAEIVDALDGVE
jgi:6-phosphogluconolactonase/glucosamine-6-phosphate isomerase/deaminase